MRRNTRFSTKQRNSTSNSGGTVAPVFFGSLASGYQAQGLFSSLNKVYIRNFHEYHHRARSNDATKRTVQNDRQVWRDQGQQEQKIDPKDLQDKINQSINGHVSLANKSIVINGCDRLKESDKKMPEKLPTQNVINVCALVRRNRYSTKTFYNRGALNENRLKKSIATGHQLHLNKMVFAYKMEHLQDHHDRLLDEYEKLIQKFRTVNRDCNFIGRDLDKLKQNYCQTLAQLLEKDQKLKEEGRLRIFKFVPRLTNLNQIGDQRQFNAVYDRWSMSADRLNSMTITDCLQLRTDLSSPRPDYHHEECEDKKLVNGNSVLNVSKPTEDNHIDDKITCNGLTNCVEEQTQELLHIACTENGAKHLISKFQQLLQDNRELRNHLQHLKIQLQRIKQGKKSVNTVNGIRKQNGVKTNGIVTNEEMNGSLKSSNAFKSNRLSDRLVQSPCPTALSGPNQLNRNTRHTVNLPHRPRPKTAAFKQIKELETMNEQKPADSVQKIKFGIRNDEAELRIQQLKNNVRCLQEEITGVEQVSYSTRQNEDQLRQDIQEIRNQLENRKMVTMKLLQENRNLSRRVEQLQTKSLDSNLMMSCS